MEKDWKTAELWDWYGVLLTERQREIFDLYYNRDCSLGEIGEEFGITRQSVRDALLKVRENLERYEECLHLSEKSAAVRELCREGREQFADARVSELLERIQKTVEG